MGLYWLTFRLENDASYKDRYAAFVAAIEEIGPVWKDPTSFCLVSTTGTPYTIAAALLPKIRTTKDLILIGSMETKGALLVGTAPNLKQLQKLYPDLEIYTPPPPTPVFRRGLLGK